MKSKLRGVKLEDSLSINKNKDCAWFGVGVQRNCDLPFEKRQSGLGTGEVS